MKSKHKLDNFTNDEIIDILNNSKSFLEAIKKFGYQSISTGHYKQVKNELKEGGKIMIAYDGSEIPNAAVDMAIKTTKPAKGSVTILHIYLK